MALAYLRLPKGNTFSIKETSNPSSNVCSEKFQRVYVNQSEKNFANNFSHEKMIFLAYNMGWREYIFVYIIENDN
jgi:hypothetical protein